MGDVDWLNCEMPVIQVFSLRSSGELKIAQPEYLSQDISLLTKHTAYCLRHHRGSSRTITFRRLLVV